jgi:hypothetical protein
MLCVFSGISEGWCLFIWIADVSNQMVLENFKQIKKEVAEIIEMELEGYQTRQDWNT